MILLIVILAVLFLLSFWGGFRHLLRLEHLNQKLVINSFLVIMIVLTLMTIAHWLNLLTESIAANITMGVYTIVAGFFAGFGNKLIKMRSDSGSIEYMYRSFWTETAPALLSVALVAFGIYRTGVLSLGPFTGIGVTSGLSLITFGFWGWTIRIVPEFRAKGVLILDQFISWQKVLSYSWNSEESIRIDYYGSNGKLTEFSTFIPIKDRKNIEQLLSSKIEEHREAMNENIRS